MLFVEFWWILKDSQGPHRLSEARTSAFISPAAVEDVTAPWLISSEVDREVLLQVVQPSRVSRAVSLTSDVRNGADVHGSVLLQASA